MKHLNDRDLDDASRWLRESPRNRALEALIVLVVMFYFLQFWFIDRIITLRSRLGKLEKVGVGSGINDEKARG